MDYNTLYKKNSITDNTKDLSPLVRNIIKRLPHPSAYLDLGCGQGNDALTMASMGHSVTAVDSAEEAISQLNTIILEKNITMNVVHSTIHEFPIERDTYDIISALNSLHYLSPEVFFQTIDTIKNGLKNRGFVVLSMFTTEDPSFLIQNEHEQKKTFLEPQKMLKLFSTFRIYNYFENIVLDPGHIGRPEPHKHGIVKIVAQKT